MQTEKITLQELRIDNIVQDDNEHPFVVSLPLLAQIKSDSYNYYGIPLTPEILEKCGFYLKDIGSSSYDNYITKNGLCISIAKADIPYGYNDKANCWYIGDNHTEITSLHHLQNYVYFVHGIELTISL